MLEIKEIFKSYKLEQVEQKVLKGVSISFRENEFVSILGASGSGKTTLLNAIGGLDTYDKGDLIIDGVSTKKYKDADWDEYRNEKIGFIFQSYNLIMHQTILANVELALTLSGVSKGERKQKAIKALEEVGLKEQIHKRPGQLSGGQMQRVAIARALVNNPKIILADEPTGALDSETSIQIMDLLKKIARDKLVIMVTHNNELAEQYSTRIVRLKDGLIEGDTDPYNPESINKEKKKSKNTSMKFTTAFSLSLNNLMTKKGRTILTAIAGSIGIVGIALILSLSNGVNKYVKKMEKDVGITDSIKIEETSGIIDFSTEKDDDKKAENKIIAQNDITTMSATKTNLAKKNNLVKFKEYLDAHKDEISKYSSNVQYEYKTNFQIYTKNIDGKIEKVNSFESSENSAVIEEFLKNSFSELNTSKDVLNEQYEILSGELPKDYNELLLVVNEKGEIPLSTLYSLGLEDRKELSELIEKTSKGEEIEAPKHEYDYNSFIGKEYKLILNADYYEKINEKWIDNSKNYEYLKELYENGITLKITGVAKSKEYIDGGTMGYTNKLVEEVSSKTKQKEIVIEQTQNKNVDVITKLAFNGIDSTYENTLRQLGAIDLDKPLSISIFLKDAESKQGIKEFIENYNKTVEDKDKIEYSDLTQSLLSGITGIVKVVSVVLIAIVAIALVVSGIMISIITYISVLERTKEIGILRAIGASKKDVRRVFNAETLIEGFIAGVLGVGTAFILTLIVNGIANLIWKTGSIAVLPIGGAGVLVLISSILTLIAGAIPSGMASKKKPVESLRGE